MNMPEAKTSWSLVALQPLIAKTAYAGEKGGVFFAVIGGLTATEIAAFGGLIVAAISALVNIGMNFYFKWQHLKLARKNQQAMVEE